MKRAIEEDLLQWKNKPRRLPLLLRGARQVGKTYIVHKIGKEAFEHFIAINFEQNPEYKRCFDTLEPKRILLAIEVLTGETIVPGKTLLFFDEIQECKEAIMALRYFKEEIPDLHIIGAGSLLEFVLHDADFRMPVGRVEFLYLRPLSFTEYLEASGKERIKQFLKNIHLGDAAEEAVHQKILNHVREYLALGGMPAVVAEYLQSHNLLECQNIQSGLLMGYRNDFGKYAKRTPHEHLQKIFDKAPSLIGLWLKYASLDPELRAQTLKKALQKLCDAGLLILIYATSGTGLPFISHINEKKCKMLFLDIGLVKRACNLDIKLLFKEDLLLINQGALAEQFVGQELLAYFSKQEINNLFSWYREEKSSSAEIDYLINIDSLIVPIEVKAGAIGSLRSLKIFMSEKKSSIGIRISENELSFNQNILSIPFYLIEELPRLLKEALSSLKH